MHYPAELPKTIGDLLALNAVERYEAARRMDAKSDTSLWIVLACILGAILLGTVIFAVLVVRAERRRRRRAFEALGERAGLDDHQIALLADIARRAALRDPTTVFTSEAAFKRGLTELRRSDALHEGAPNDAREELAAALVEKLGFGSEPALEQTGTSLPGHLPEGGEVAVVHRGQTGDHHGTIRHVTDSELVVESEIPASAVRPGETWLLRYGSGEAIWEFEATVVRGHGRRFILNRPEQFRKVNRRRFPRVPTSKPAQVAAAGGLRREPADKVPVFVPGTVVEIGASGLKVETELRASAGQSVLAVVQLAPDRVLEAMGKVRRLTTGERGTPELVIELVGLSGEETAELVRATNAAALENPSATRQEAGTA